MKKRYLFFLLLIFTNSFLFAQSPWTKEKGEIYSQLNYSTISNYNEIFGSPDYTTPIKITDNTFQLYIEYGVSNKTTLILNAPFKNISTGKQNFQEDIDPLPLVSKTKNALGNLEIGVKHNFYPSAKSKQEGKKKWLITGQFMLETNTSTYDDQSGIRTGYDAFTFTPTLNIGRSFNNNYIQAFTGFNIRTNDYSSNFRFGSEFGKKVFDRIWFIGFLDFVFSLENGDYQEPFLNTFTALYVNEQEYTAYGIKIIGEISPEFGIIAGFGGAFSGNNVAKQAAINIGLYYKIKPSK